MEFIKFFIKNITLFWKRPFENTLPKNQKRQFFKNRKTNYVGLKADLTNGNILAKQHTVLLHSDYVGYSCISQL